MKPTIDIRRSILFGAISGVILALAFIGGYLFRDNLDLFSSQVADYKENYPLLHEVQNIINQVYLYEQPSHSERQYAAIRGVLATLSDPHTFFIEPPVAQSEADALAGTYGGIGVTIQRTEDGRVVLFPLSDTPAFAAGIQDNDVLLAIGGTVVDAELSLDAINQLLRGEVKVGNGVEIAIMRGDMQEDFFIEFAEINIPSVVWRVLQEDTRIGYIHILKFTARTPIELEGDLQELLNNDISALILDLRDNSGGLLVESVQVASQFLNGQVVIHERTQSSEETFSAEEGGLALETPLVVLINERTASASELVAGALQDHGRAILIGQTTFGKGTVQQIFPLSDGSSVHITSSEWFTPNEFALNQIGLTPDIPMIPDENGRDVELGEAIRYLQTVING